MIPLEIRVASQEGVDVRQVIKAIEATYTTSDGKSVEVRTGSGREAGYLFIEETKRG